MQTVGHELAKYKGYGPGFNFLRIGLAVSIVLYHTLGISGRHYTSVGPVVWFLEYSLVPMFFALSGFLITGSAQRLDLKNFLINRGMRIVPALAVDIMICAFIIGPAVTSVSLAAYFTAPQFYSYMLNIIGWPHYLLPGVFENNLSPKVNGALWTIPWEIFCYIIMSFLMVTAAIKRPSSTALVLLAYFVCGLIVEQFAAENPIAYFLFVSRGSQLIAAFLCGILAYQMKDRLPYSIALFGLAVAACAIAVFTLSTPDIEHVANRAILIPALTYIVAFIGVTRIPMPTVLEKGDYSYGVYLYHLPLLQLLIHINSDVFVGPWGFAMLAVFGLPLVFAVAAISWHGLEKPILAFRKKFSFQAQHLGTDQPTFPNVSSPATVSESAS